jgi:hypothetical protein
VIRTRPAMRAHMAGNSMTPGRSVISKVSAILLTVAEDDRSTLTEIASRTDLPLSTCHRLVAELTAWGVLERTGDSRFRAGPPLRKISGPGRCHHDEAVSGIREQVAPVMEDLFRVTGAPVRVGFLDGMGVAYVEKSSAHVPVSDLSPARLPVHATAVGKALLAFTSPRTAALILAGTSTSTRHGRSPDPIVCASICAPCGQPDSRCATGSSSRSGARWPCRSWACPEVPSSPSSSGSGTSPETCPRGGPRSR